MSTEAQREQTAKMRAVKAENDRKRKAGELPPLPKRTYKRRATATPDQKPEHVARVGAATVWALSVPTLQPIERLVLIALGASGDGPIPPPAVLAAALEVPERTVGAAIVTLTERGFIAARTETYLVRGSDNGQ
jgi:hypothetical protein